MTGFELSLARLSERGSLRAAEGQNMFFDHPKFTSTQSTTFREFVLLPRLTGAQHHLSEVSLAGELAPGLSLSIPFLSAAMESVSGQRLAVALALQGGLSVLPAGNVTPEDQVEMVRSVKSHRPGFIFPNRSVEPDASIAELLEMVEDFGTESFPVVGPKGQLLGLISSRMVNPLEDQALPVHSRMLPRPQTPVAEVTADEREWGAQGLASGLGVVCLVNSENQFQGVVDLHEYHRARGYSSALRDSQGRLAVAVAVSTHPEDLERAKACVEAGADALAVDASDGYSVYMQATVEKLKELGVPVIAGNVVEADGFRYLAEAGADAVKVGIGSGSICTTRRVKAIGRGQATAVVEVARARDQWAQETGRYLPIISDGGLQGTGDMSVALALGADFLMMGKYFAGFEESPTQAYLRRFPVQFGGEVSEVEVPVKPYWGEASRRAKNVRRYQQNDPRTFVIEGEEGFVLLKGSLHDSVPRDLKAIQGTLSSCGCRDLSDFRQNALLEFQSTGSQREGGTSIFRA